MNKQQAAIIVGIGILLVLAATPYLLTLQSEPLVPQDFAVTATLYKETESFLETKEIRDVREATSIFITLPAVEEPLPGDPDYTPPADSSYDNPGSTRMLINNHTATTVTGVAEVDLPVYTCPSRSRQTEDMYMAGEMFTVIGQARDIDDNLYLLISDEPSAPQVWLRIDDTSVVTLSADVDTAPRVSCRIAVTTPQAPPSRDDTTDASQPAATRDQTNIPLPQPITATPVLLPAEFVLTDETAVEQIVETVPELQDPTVTILDDTIEIAGRVQIAAMLSGPLQATGQLETFESNTGFTKIQINIESLTVSGRNYSGQDEEAEVEQAINNWFVSLLRGSDVQTYTQEEGRLSIDALQLESVALEMAEETPETTPDPNVTPTITPTFTIITATPGGATPTRIMGNTATPQPEGLPSETPVPVRTSNPLAEQTAEMGATTVPDETVAQPQVIEEGDALSDAVQSITAFAVTDLRFTDDNMMTLQGLFDPPSNIIGEVPFTLRGSLIAENDEMQFMPETFILNNLSVKVGDYPIMTDAVNSWLTELSTEEVQSVDVQEGALRINP